MNNKSKFVYPIQSYAIYQTIYPQLATKPKPYANQETQTEQEEVTPSTDDGADEMQVSRIEEVEKKYFALPKTYFAMQETDIPMPVGLLD
jgi:hypothetical protein